MESKEIKIERMMYRFYHKIGVWLLPMLLITAIILLLSSCRSTTAAYGTQRTIRDSVTAKYKTVLRDSIRIRDSVRIVTKTKERDSVVLRVDKETGEVLSTDTWHWKDTNKNRDHVSETKNKTEKSDSAASVVAKSDKRTVVTKDNTKPSDVKETHYWKTYCLGILTGVLIMLLWKYRKILIGLLKKAIRLRI